jgi:hypothetical protein
MTSLLDRLSLGTDSESNTKDLTSKRDLDVKSEPSVDDGDELSGSEDEKTSHQNHSHESDSGLGTSVSSVESDSAEESKGE